MNGNELIAGLVIYFIVVHIFFAYKIGKSETEVRLLEDDLRRLKIKGSDK